MTLLFNKETYIAFFAPNLQGGGAERIVARLASHFSNQSNCRVDLLLLEKEGPYLKDISENVNIINLNSRKAIHSLPKLIKYLNHHKPDILFSSQIHISTVALLANKLSKKQTRVIIRQPTMLRPKYKRQSYNIKLRQMLFLKLALSADKIIVSSKSMKDELLTLSGVDNGRIVTIYNPLPIKTIRKESLANIDHPWFQKSEPPIILSVGRLVTVKDFQTLVDAFDIVNRTISARLIILGEGPLRGELQQHINKLGLQKSILLPGFATNPFKYMRHSSVYVLSSLWEGFPNSLIEAMACHLPIVATNCEGGTSEILDGGLLGKLVPVQDSEAMAKAILECLAGYDTPKYESKLNDFSDRAVFDQYSYIFFD